MELKDYIIDLFQFCQFYQKFMKNFERESIYHQYQPGYRKNHSTATLLLKLLDDIKKAMKIKKLP